MNVLIVTKGLQYYRYFAPVVSAMFTRLPDVRITLVTTDPENYSVVETTLHYDVQKMVSPGSGSTRVIRRLRPLFAYIYWLLLDVQSEIILEKKSDKFLSASLGEFRRVIKPGYIRQTARAFRLLKIHRIIARVGLAFFRLLEVLFPADRNIVLHVKDLSPDIILVTPAIHWRSFEMDYARAGLRLGIPTVTIIGSWDHLTTKGLLSVITDRVLVWNDEVTEPVAVRYGWEINPGCNLYNKEGLPASPFCTDNWKWSTDR